MQNSDQLLEKGLSGQRLHCLPFHLHLLMPYCIVKPNCSISGTIMVHVIILDVSIFMGAFVLYMAHKKFTSISFQSTGHYQTTPSVILLELLHMLADLSENL